MIGFEIDPFTKLEVSGIHVAQTTCAHSPSAVGWRAPPELGQRTQEIGLVVPGRALLDGPMAVHTLQNHGPEGISRIP